MDEIRKLRGGITRRTARNSKKDGLDNASPHESPAPASHAPVQESDLSMDRRLNGAPIGGLDMRFNRLHWSSTGVITDPNVLNPSTAATPSTGVLASPTSKKRSYSAYASDLSTNTSLPEHVRALELSLREVLDCLRAATKYSQTPPSPFDFDIQSQTYPSLVLRLLPTPQTLFQPSPFSTLTTVPISAPGPDQMQALRSKITNTIDAWKWNALRLAQRTTSNIADEASFLSSQADTYTTNSLKHLQTAYENWMTHTPEIRTLVWNVELLRAYQTQKTRVDDLEEELERLKQEAAQLQQQVDYLSQCQWPREMALWPPERRTFGKQMREELRLVNLHKPPPGVAKREDGGGGETNGTPNAEGTDPIEGNPNMRTENVNTRLDKWDFEKLVNKWKAHVKEDRTRRRPWLDAVAGDGAREGADGPRHPSGMDFYPSQLRHWKSDGDREANGKVDGEKGDEDRGEQVRENDRGPRPIKKNISIISDL